MGFQLPEQLCEDDRNYPVPQIGFKPSGGQKQNDGKCEERI